MNTQQQTARLHATIARQHAEIQRLEAEIAELRQELAPFEGRFKAVVQSVLDRVEAMRSAVRDLEQTLARKQWDKSVSEEELWRGSSNTAPEQATASTAPPPEPEDLPTATKPRVVDESMKALYRRLARLYHPDLAKDDEDRLKRNRLMALINEAYSNQDHEALLELARSAPQEDKDSLKDTAQMQIPLDVLKLRGLQRQSAELAMQIADLKLEHHDLMYGTLMDIKIQETLTKAQGRDLLQEMADEYEQEYWRLMKKLDTLREG